MSTLRTTTLKHGGSTILDNLVLSNAGETRFCPNSSFGRAALYVDGQTNRVGVNTETPGVALDVDGAINATGNVVFGGTLTIDGAVTIDDGITADGTITARQLTNNALSAFEAVDSNGTRFKVTGAGVLSIYDNTLTENITLSSTGRAIFLNDISIGTDENQGLITINNHNSSDDALLKIRQASDFQPGLEGFAIDIRNQANNQGKTLIQRGLDIRFITGTGNPSETARFTDNHLLIGYDDDFGSGSSGDLLQIASNAGGHLLTGRNDTSVGNNEAMGLWRAYSRDSSTWSESGRISVLADADHTSARRPSKIVFSTRANTDNAPIEEVGQFDSDGNFGVGIDPVYPLDIGNALNRIGGSSIFTSTVTLGAGPISNTVTITGLGNVALIMIGAIVSAQATTCGTMFLVTGLPSATNNQKNIATIVNESPGALEISNPQKVSGGMSFDVTNSGGANNQLYITCIGATLSISFQVSVS